MFYYKIIENGVVTGLMTASLHCESSETQVEITEDEYLQLEEQFNQQIVESD
jgi:hypothetical protein